MSKKISAGLKMAALHFLQKKNDDGQTLCEGRSNCSIDSTAII